VTFQGNIEIDYISMFPWKVTSDKFYCTCILIIFLCSLGRSHQTSFTVHVPWSYFYVPLEGHIRQVLLEIFPRFGSVQHLNIYIHGLLYHVYLSKIFSDMDKIVLSKIHFYSLTINWKLVREMICVDEPCWYFYKHVKY
jgi:hypothetical protein